MFSSILACTESRENVCFITGKMQREREACTGSPAAASAGITAIRESQKLRGSIGWRKIGEEGRDKRAYARTSVI